MVNSKLLVLFTTLRMKLGCPSFVAFSYSKPALPIGLSHNDDCQMKNFFESTVTVHLHYWWSLLFFNLLINMILGALWSRVGPICLTAACHCWLSCSWRCNWFGQHLSLFTLAEFFHDRFDGSIGSNGVNTIFRRCFVAAWWRRNRRQRMPQAGFYLHTKRTTDIRTRG